MKMKNTLSLNNRIDKLIRKKFTICKCNPCTCSEINKDQYFKELKDILNSFNIEKFASYSFNSGIENNFLISFRNDSSNFNVNKNWLFFIN
jgi:hypothetical protein